MKGAFFPSKFKNIFRFYSKVNYVQQILVAKNLCMQFALFADRKMTYRLAGILLSRYDLLIDKTETFQHEKKFQN